MDQPESEGVDAERKGEGRQTAWEARVAALAKGLPYPPTPNLSDGARNLARLRPSSAHRPSWAAALLVVAAALALLAVPEVRAAVMRVFQVGVVRVFVTAPSQVATEPPSAQSSAAPQETPTAESLLVGVPITATPFIGPPATALPGVANAPGGAQPAGEEQAPPALARLAGSTTLEEARRLVPFPIALPGYPPDLGAPDYVFVQEHAAPVLILAWSDPNVKSGVGLSLWMFLNGTAIEKFEPETVAETTVNGRRALWTEGEHMLHVRNGSVEARRLVLGNTLIWERKEMTFRLETFLPLAEAVKVAESVR